MKNITKNTNLSNAQLQDYINEGIQTSMQLAETGSYQLTFAKIAETKKYFRQLSQRLSSEDKKNIGTQISHECHRIEGICYLRTNKYNDAYDHLSQAISYQPKKKPIITVYLLDLYATIFQDQDQDKNKREESIKKYKLESSLIDKAVTLIKEDSYSQENLSNHQKMDTDCNIAICYAALKSNEKAMEYALLVKKQALKENSLRHLVIAYHILVEASSRLGKPPEETLDLVKLTLLFAKKLSTQGGYGGSLFSVYTAAFTSYLRLKEPDFKKASEYLELASQLNELDDEKTNIIKEAREHLKIRTYMESLKWEKVIEIGIPLLKSELCLDDMIHSALCTWIATAFFNTEQFEDAKKYASISHKKQSEQNKIDQSNIIAMASYQLKDFAAVLNYIPQKISTPNCAIVLLLAKLSARYLKDEKTIQYLDDLIIKQSTTLEDSIEDYKLYTSLLLSLEESTKQPEPIIIKGNEEKIIITNVEKIAQEKNEEKTIISEVNNIAQEKIEKIEKKLSKILARNKEISFFPAPKNKVQKETGLIQMYGPFLSKDRSNLYCKLELSNEMEDFKKEYPDAFEKLENTLNAGEICKAQGQQGIKYLSASLKMQGKSYHWEVKILGGNGDGDHRLIGHKTTQEGMTIIIFDKHAGHKKIERIYKI